MRKLLYSTVAAAAIAGAAFVTLGTTPARAGAFCATQADGQSFRSCSFATYAACARTISGAGGQCMANPGWSGGGYGYEDSYAYAPGPVYGSRYGYDEGPGYYGRRPGFGIYIGGY